MRYREKSLVLVCGFAALCVATAVSTEKIHEQMTEDERVAIFQTTDENVQDYEIVRIHWPTLQKRNAYPTTRIRLRAFGKDIHLWLKPADGILAGHDTPVYTIEKGISGYLYTKYAKLLASIERWEDLERSAALAVSKTGNLTRITGEIGSENLVIKPLPERLVEEVKRKRRSIDRIPELEQDDHHYHIVYRIPELPEEAKHISGPLRDAAATLRQTSATIPDTVYPEILVVVAYDLYKKLGTIPDVIAYVLAFWHGVDLKYRNFEYPKFRLNIAGIILAADPEVLSYISNNKHDSETLVVEDALVASTDFWYKQKDTIDVYSYDVAFTMTPYALCEFGDNEECTAGILGLAYVSGACLVYPYQQTLRKVAIIQDKGAFDGILTAAHELGHLLGAHHDGTDNKDCSATDGHVMAGVPVLTEKTSDWSECSLKDIQTFLDTDPTCLYNKPILTTALPMYLPGKFIDADKQCNIIEGTKACKIDSSICQRIGCVFRDNPRYCSQKGFAAAEGTKCGENMICLHGQCIDTALLEYS